MLDQKLIELAYKNLGETEQIRNESLEKLKIWLSEKESLKNLIKCE